MSRVKFTNDQQLFIAEVIGNWYLKWKLCITPVNAKGFRASHSLGYAKEELIQMLCEGKSKVSDYTSLSKKILETEKESSEEISKILFNIITQIKK